MYSATHIIKLKIIHFSFRTSRRRKTRQKRCTLSVKSIAAVILYEYQRKRLVGESFRCSVWAKKRLKNKLIFYASSSALMTTHHQDLSFFCSRSSKDFHGLQHVSGIFGLAEMSRWTLIPITHRKTLPGQQKEKLSLSRNMFMPLQHQRSTEDVRPR
jgi:hypothetical protein